MNSRFALLVALLAPFTAHADPLTPDPATTEPATGLCVIPLGVIPELIPQLQNGVMGFAPEKEGTRPPSETKLWIRKKEGAFINIALNMPSDLIPVKGTEAIEIRVPGPVEAGKKPTWKPWIELPLIAPGKSQSVFLTKASAKGDWLSAPKQWAFDDSPEVFPPGSIRVVNFSSLTALVIIGEQKLQIASGKQTIVRPPDDVVPIQVAVQKDGQAIPTLNTARKVDRPERLVLATFDWDGVVKPGSAATPAKSVLLYMPTPPPAVNAAVPPTTNATVMPR